MQQRHNLIPPRWLRCPPMGELIADTFLAFKTPLDSRYDSQIPEEYRFDINMLFRSLSTYHIKLGMIINLTNTDRYYKMEVVERKDCVVISLPCRGYGETPSPEFTNMFIDHCETFIRKNPLQNIGVHCTHGFNRSGFLIISYLVQKLQWSLDAALNTFAKKRPPGIYKQDYIDELCNRFPNYDIATMAPALPNWCTESDDGDRDDDGNRIDASNGASYSHSLSGNSNLTEIE